MLPTRFLELYFELPLQITSLYMSVFWYLLPACNKHTIFYSLSNELCHSQETKNTNVKSTLSCNVEKGESKDKMDKKNQLLWIGSKKLLICLNSLCKLLQQLSALILDSHVLNLQFGNDTLEISVQVGVVHCAE